MKTIIARAAAGDAVWILATVNRIAEILAADGDTDPMELRRSKAIGIVAQPAKALQLLAEHCGDVSLAEDSKDDHRSLITDPPSQAQVRSGRPRAVLVFHLSDAAISRGHGMVRPEHGEAISLEELRGWLAETGCASPCGRWSTRPIWLRSMPTRSRNGCATQSGSATSPTCFPFGSCTTATMDLDHTIPWRPMEQGGPPGQTRRGNLGPFTRSHHRTVTHGRWRRRQPEPGQFVFRSPTGTIYLVTNQGTLRLGSSPFAEAVWRAAESSQTEEEAA